MFYDMFYEMERLGVLDPNNDVHIWCLHLVYLTILNQHLTNWKKAWIHHPMRSERNKSPLQLWINGLNAISASGSTVAQEIFQVRSLDRNFRAEVSP